jgi:hypothetical protein
MKPATSEIPNNIRKQIGPAIWLLLLLARYTPAEYSGDGSAWVSGGNVVSDAELAQRLEVSIAVVGTWRHRLRRAGLLGWLVSAVPGAGRAFWVAAVNRACAVGEEKQATDATEKQTAALPACPAAIWRVIQERSIAVTGKVVEDLGAFEAARVADVLAKGSENPEETWPV